jgi:sulfur relay protein TusB/DsrH
MVKPRMLIILNRSPWAENWSFILEIAKKMAEKGEKVAVLHVQDACIAATISEYCDKLADNNVEVYALSADCKARGLTEISEKVKLVDYKQCVKLMMNEHEKIVSWTS